MNTEQDEAAIYLKRLKRALRTLPSEDRDTIVAEIQSHIADRTASVDTSVSETLESLGNPEELAQAYLEQYQLEDALARSATGPLMVVIFRRATRSLLALVTGFGALTLYLCCLSFAAIAVLKPVLPQQVGMWWGDKLWGFGIIDRPPTNTPELLGYGIIPVAVAACVLCYLGGTALMRFGGQLLLRNRAIPQL